MRAGGVGICCLLLSYPRDAWPPTPTTTRTDRATTTRARTRVVIGTK
ncbi:Uncharacterized protein ToN1_37470 [Aromatoleum petrolei]|nr:Uncharacterized protein ToN1_37470 [Aromatoleum petrolei]